MTKIFIPKMPSSMFTGDLPRIFLLPCDGETPPILLAKSQHNLAKLVTLLVPECPNERDPNHHRRDVNKRLATIDGSFSLDGTRTMKEAILVATVLIVVCAALWFANA